MFWKKEEEMFTRVKSYFEKADLARDAFKNAFADLIRQTPNVDYPAVVEKVHKAEHEADVIRRQIVLELYKKALIPGSREDILTLLESFDEIVNTFQTVCNQLHFQRVVFPEQYRERLIDLAEVNNAAYNYTKEAAVCLFEETCLTNRIELIGVKERESDSGERGLIRDIFSSEIDLAEKLLFKQIIISLGNISDYCEKVGDIIELAVIKRKI